MILGLWCPEENLFHPAKDLDMPPFVGQRCPNCGAMTCQPAKLVLDSHVDYESLEVIGDD